MIAVFDTNYFREIAFGTPLSERIKLRAAEQRIELFTSIVTVQETNSGWLALINSKKAGRDQINAYRRFQTTVTAFNTFDILPFDDEAATVFHRRQDQRTRVGTMDLKIASICIAHAATLLTRNIADFDKIPDLRVENWLD